MSETNGQNGGNGANGANGQGPHEHGADAAQAAPEGQAPGQGQAQEPAPAPDRIAELEAQNALLRERALRALAEADNTRKRAERDSAVAREYAIEKFATDLLKVADNLSRALTTLPADAAATASEPVRNLLAGVELTERELMRVFERYRITPIDPKGEPFDPNLHQAVAQFPSEVPAGRVAEVMQTGFKLGDRVLRAAMVAVSTGPAAATKPSPYGDTPPAPRTDFKI